jgi:chromosome segregation ATPase
MRPVVVLLACAALAACGGDDDGNLSTEDYRDRANELCAKANDEAEKLDPPTSPDELADFLERGLEVGRDYDQRFRDLDPPAELERLHERAVRLSDEFEERFERLIDQVRAADEPLKALQDGLQSMLGDIREGDELNRRLGLDECLEVPALPGTGEGPA